MARSLTSTHGYDLDSSVVSPGVFSQSQSQSNTALPSPVLPLSKKRNVVFANLESSPASEADDADPNGERKRQPVKRACNECRQQKVSGSGSSSFYSSRSLLDISTDNLTTVTVTV